MVATATGIQVRYCGDVYGVCDVMIAKRTNKISMKTGKDVKNVRRISTRGRNIRQNVSVKERKGQEEQYAISTNRLQHFCFSTKFCIVVVVHNKLQQLHTVRIDKLYL